MTIHIHHAGNADEVEAIKAFLKWQNTNYTVNSVPDGELIKLTGGRGTPVLRAKGEIVAVSFRGLLKHWEASGLYLC